ncbi:MAG: hypothetical protein K0R00_78 [Herbinix sp.]|jgi:hypothetical protein|nr:hypothetical protein [Herbinix sp.]
MKENYYALLICILRPVSIERSLQMMVDEEFTRQRDENINDEDIESMIKMKKSGMTYGKIGEIFGLAESATYRRIKRYKERMKK